MTNDSGNTLVPLEHDPVQPGFDIAIRGYDRGQVDRQITWLEGQLDAADRLAETAQESLRRAQDDAAHARRAAEKANAELDRGRPTFDALGERIVAILILAEEEAAALRAAARTETEQLRKQVADELTASRREMDEQRRAAEQQASAAVAQARRDAEGIVADARRSATEITSAAQRQVEATTRQRDAIHAELVRVRERFAAVLGGQVDLSEAPEEKTRPMPGPSVARQDEPRPTRSQG